MLINIEYQYINKYIYNFYYNISSHQPIIKSTEINVAVDSRFNKMSCIL